MSIFLLRERITMVNYPFVKYNKQQNIANCAHQSPASFIYSADGQ